jgi:hypothetical protein
MLDDKFDNLPSSLKQIIIALALIAGFYFGAMNRDEPIVYHEPVQQIDTRTTYDNGECKAGCISQEAYEAYNIWKAKQPK